MRSAEAFDEVFKETLREIPALEGQVGAVVFDDAGVLGFEWYDSPESWSAVAERVWRKYEHFLGRVRGGGFFSFRVDDARARAAAAEFLGRCVAVPMRVAVAIEGSRTVVGDAAGLVVEVNEHAGRAIHAVGYRG